MKRRLLKLIKKNVKYFFLYAKKFSKITKVCPLLDKKQKYISDSKVMADVLQMQYKCVFNKTRGEKK